MSVSFHNVSSVDRCEICYDSMADSDAVTHDGGGGDKHTPWHRECIKSWIASSNNNKCPFCAIPTDASSLYTWKERIMINIKTDAGIGAGIGAYVGLCASDIGVGLTATTVAIAAGTVAGAVVGVVAGATGVILSALHLPNPLRLL